MSFDLLEKLNNRPEGITIAPRFDKSKINIAMIVTKDSKNNDNKDEYRSFIQLADVESTTISSTAPETKMIPLIATEGDRNLIYITGPSGAGKSIIAAEFCKQYHSINPKNRVFYVCSTDIKDDKTWGEMTDFVTPIDITEIYGNNMDQEEEREMIKTLFANSLIVFDDLDMMPKEKKKIMNRFQGKIVEVGRKYECNAIIISHIVCGGINTKMILNECNMYITFKGMIKGNRFLKSYKGFTDAQLENIKTTSWACFNFRCGYIITPQSVKKL